jgi:hypothetical protein
MTKEFTSRFDVTDQQNDDMNFLCSVGRERELELERGQHRATSHHIFYVREIVKWSVDFERIFKDDTESVEHSRDVEDRSIHLTEDSADIWLQENIHDYPEAFVYVDSMFRSPQMIKVFAILERMGRNYR